MSNIVVFQSDFGLDSGLVASMHGVCLTVDTNLRIFDITHLIPPFNIKAASEFLYYTLPCYPQGTVFVSVVDPGVGTERKASVAKTKNGYYIVTPDNGTLTFISKYYGIEEIREIDESLHYFKETEFIDVFHGRDLFAYTGAKLASGGIIFEEAGARYPVHEIVTYEIPEYFIHENRIEGVSFGTSGNKDDGFGILMTNIPNKVFKENGYNFGDKVLIEISDNSEIIFSEKVLYHQSFGYVDQGQPVLHPEINTFLGLALNMGNFCRKYDIKSDKHYMIKISKD